MSKDTISIVVLSYNQQNVILDCLNSILFQKNFIKEIIISDDCSTDNTLNVINEWCQKNQSKLNVPVIILQNKTNLGIVKNKLKAIKHCSGSIVKSIGGDDFLAPDACEKVLQFFTCNNSDIVVSKIFRFKFISDGIYQLLPQPSGTEIAAATGFFTTDALGQFRRLSIGNCLSAPGVFAKRELLLNIAKFSDHIKYIEDWPLWLSLTLSGIHIDYLDDNLVYYRIHDNQVSAYYHINDNIINKDIIRDKITIYEMLIIPNLYLFSTIDKISIMHSYKIYKLLYKQTNNKYIYEILRYYGLRVLRYLSSPNHLLINRKIKLHYSRKRASLFRFTESGITSY